jgi:hypothetical protein
MKRPVYKLSFLILSEMLVYTKVGNVSTIMRQHKENPRILIQTDKKQIGGKGKLVAMYA